MKNYGHHGKHNRQMTGNNPHFPDAADNEQCYPQQARNQYDIVYAPPHLQYPVPVQKNDDRVYGADQDTEYHQGILPADEGDFFPFRLKKTGKVEGINLSAQANQSGNRNEKHRYQKT
jgi:hypothetical protein